MFQDLAFRKEAEEKNMYIGGCAARRRCEMEVLRRVGVAMLRRRRLNAEASAPQL